MCVCVVIAQDEIVAMEAEKVRDIEDMREKMVKATNEAALTVMGLDNELADLEVGHRRRSSSLRLNLQFSNLRQ